MRDKSTEDRRLVLRNARIGTGGALGDLIIVRGRVAGVAERADRLPGDDVVDVGGGTVLPGLWDAHVHSVQWAMARRRFDLTAAVSAREAARLAAERCRSAAPGETVFGYGFRDAFWSDTPHKDMLEAALPGRAVVLVSNDLHTAWLSPAALALAGHGDHRTGVLREQDCYQAIARLPAASAEQIDDWVCAATSAAAERGVVGIIDFELADNVTDWRRRARSGHVDVRVSCSIPRSHLETAIERGLRTGGIVDGCAGRLEVGPLKIFVDGSLNTRTAFCADPYPGAPGAADHGLLETPAEELHAVMRRAADHGLHPAVHAIGDLAAAIALDAFEEIGCPGRIEHAQLLRAEDPPRFARTGLVASVQPAHCPDDRDVAETHWEGRTERAFAYASLRAAGATLEFGSDAPVAPLDPWDGIASAVARTDDERPSWHPEQALSLPDALAASSRGRRAIQAGSPADLMIVERDPADLPVAELRNPTVLGTLLDGRWTHRAEALA
jgi:predicted amidohydrolase YtcJ